MKNILVEMMARLTTLSTEEVDAIEKSFPVKTFPTDTYLLKEGQIAQDSYFVAKGCIREYELNDGEENTTAFYTENQSAINFSSLADRQPSKCSFVCAEPTTVAIINARKEKELYSKHPRFETFCRTGMEQMIGQQQRDFFEFRTMNPEERYLKLLAERPALLQRVPQYQIASYLGVKPETLSRIRKRISSKS